MNLKTYTTNFILLFSLVISYMQANGQCAPTYVEVTGPTTVNLGSTTDYSTSIWTDGCSLTIDYVEWSAGFNDISGDIAGATVQWIEDSDEIVMFLFMTD